MKKEKVGKATQQHYIKKEKLEIWGNERGETIDRLFIY